MLDIKSILEKDLRPPDSEIDPMKSPKLKIPRKLNEAEEDGLYCLFIINIRQIEHSFSFNKLFIRAASLDRR